MTWLTKTVFDRTRKGEDISGELPPSFLLSRRTISLFSRRLPQLIAMMSSRIRKVPLGDSGTALETPFIGANHFGSIEDL